VNYGEEEGKNEGWLQQGKMKDLLLLPIMKNYSQER
jgi:hypothetical protein